MRDVVGRRHVGADRPVCYADLYKIIASYGSRQQTAANLIIKIENLPNYFDLSLIWSIFANELEACNTYYKVLRPKLMALGLQWKGEGLQWLNIYQFKLLILKFHSIYVVM